MKNLSPQQVKESIQRYRWYHAIEVMDGIFTESQVPQFQEMWDFDMRCLETIDFRGKRVLDIGCRDGLFSFLAERRGAREVVGIDNDISNGAVEFLIPYFGSKVTMHELNLYNLDPATIGKFDVILFFGVLYHLRYPYWGLRKIVDCLADQGQLLIESGMLVAKFLESQEILYCPVERSPYGEPSSCTFFNQLALEVTLRSMNVRIDDAHRFEPGRSSATSGTPPQPTSLLNLARATKQRLVRACGIGRPPAMDIARQFFVCRKDENLQKSEIVVDGGSAFPKDWATTYWDGTHDEHSRKRTK